MKEVILNIPNSDYYIDIVFTTIYYKIENNYIALKDEDVYTIPINGILVTKPYDWFKWYTIYPVVFPTGYENNLSKLEYRAYVKIKNVDNSKILTRFMEFSTPVIYIINNTTFYLLPFSPRYAVSENGLVYDTFNSTYLQEKTKHMSGYRYVYLQKTYFDITSKKYITKLITRGIHQVVAETWLKRPSYTQPLVIDHINSVKTDNRVQNLAWVTYKDNAIKELYNNNEFPFILRNVDTLNVTKHKSLEDVSKYIGRSRIRLNLTPLVPGRLFVGTNGRFELRKVNDGNTWYYKYKLNGLIPHIKCVFLDKEEIYFNNLREAINYFKYLENIGHHKTPSLASLFKVLKQYNITAELIIRQISGRPDSCFEMLNIYTNEHIISNSLNNLAKQTGVPSATLYKHIRNKRTKTVLNGWLCREYTDDEWPTEYSNVRIDNKRELVMTAGDGETKQFSSYAEAASVTGKSTKYLSSCVKYKYNINWNNKKWKIQTASAS